MYFNEITHLDIRKTPTLEWYDLERLPYLVNVNMLWQIVFQFDPETSKFYVDEENFEKTQSMLEEHQKEAKAMEDDGVSEEEIKEHFKGKGEYWIDRQEYVLLYGKITEPENLAKIVRELIRTNHNL